MTFDATIPSEIAFAKGSKGGVRIVFNNGAGDKISEVLVSVALKDQVIQVLTALKHSTLIGNTAKESKENLKNLLSKMGDAMFNKSFPLLTPQPMVRTGDYIHNEMHIITSYSVCMPEMLLRSRMHPGHPRQPPVLLHQVPQQTGVPSPEGGEVQVQ